MSWRRRVVVTAMSAIVGATGCTKGKMEPDGPEQSALPSASEIRLAEFVADEPQVSADEQSVLDTAAELFEKARVSGQTSATDAAEWMRDRFNDGTTVAGDSVDWVNDLFRSLKHQGLTSADNATQWVNDDFRAMYAWEYKVISLVGNDAESEQQLNKLGQDRWECFHVEGKNFYLKRQSRSYLRHVPMKDLIKLAPLIGSEAE